jgi:hypothetical protein
VHTVAAGYIALPQVLPLSFLPELLLHLRLLIRRSLCATFRSEGELLGTDCQGHFCNNDQKRCTGNFPREAASRNSVRSLNSLAGAAP